MLKKTALEAWHIAQGAKMVGFAGWNMPLLYKDGIIASHNFLRANAGVFDVFLHHHFLHFFFTNTIFLFDLD
jgi:glycine cleavage system aminomethyltransferase T